MKKVVSSINNSNKRGKEINDSMNKPQHLKKGDKIAIVSLSSGILGEAYCEHQLKLGIKRLKSFGLKPVMMNHTLKGVHYLLDHPEFRASDLKQAFFDDSIKGILCAIGGDETYRLLPYLLDDQAFIEKVKTSPKLFTGFSDTTNNHLMFYKLGMVSYYGPNFLSDLAELGKSMLPYTKSSWMRFFINPEKQAILPSPTWYLERKDFSIQSLGIKRIAKKETKGYQVLYGNGTIQGRLLGGCLESLYDGYTGTRYPEQKNIYEHYQLMPTLNEWNDKILFFETSEECPSPDLFETYMDFFAQQGIFDVIKGVLIGKPQNETYYKAYKTILTKYAKKYHLPMIMNLNFGHSYPRNVIPYGILVEVDLDHPNITIIEPMFSNET
jgi:muramoyltetrapeptide carboxypeptidase LdcA involved in peptidoglycan recycling